MFLIRMIRMALEYVREKIESSKKENLVMSPQGGYTAIQALSKIMIEKFVLLKYVYCDTISPNRHTMKKEMISCQSL